MNSRLLSAFLMQWLVKHGTDPIEPFQLGVFDMDLYTKCARLKYLVSGYDEKNVKFWVRLSPEGVAFIKENTK